MTLTDINEIRKNATGLKYAWRFIIAFALCMAWGGCTSMPDRKADGSFSERYHTYQALSQAGYASINKKDYKAAIDQYTQAIALSPFVPADHYYRGLAWYKNGNNEKAIADFDDALLLDSHWVLAYVYRGLARVNRGEYAEALNDYAAALKLNEKDPVIHNDLAWLYATAKDEKFRDKEKALEHAKKAAELSKEGNAEILDTLAQAYFINGEIQEALEAAQKAVQLDSQNQGFKEHLADYQKALEENKIKQTTAGSKPNVK
jgi:tetratricopeptide (TPR) repeat protein